jgi:hypothetical protein
MEIAGYFAEELAGDENVSRYALREGEQTRVEPPVRVQLAALRALRLGQTELERYIRVSFASQERLSGSYKALSWLAESQRRPEKLESDDYWLRGDELISRIEVLLSFLGDLQLEDDEFARWGARFDASHDRSTGLVGTMKRPAGAEDPQNVASQLEAALSDMNNVSAEVLRLCERKAERVIEEMKQWLTRIFERIETERQTLEMVARQHRRTELSEFDELKQSRTASQSEQPHDERPQEAEAVLKESQSKKSGSQSRTVSAF